MSARAHALWNDRAHTHACAERQRAGSRSHFSRTIKAFFYGTSESVLVPCAHCGVGLKKSEATLDHILPKSVGGPLDITNTAIACNDCNQRRGARDFWGFRDSMARTREERRRRADARRSQHAAEVDDALHAQCRRLAGQVAEARGIERRRFEREVAQLRVALFIAVRGLVGRDAVPESIAVLARLMPEAVTREFVATPEEIEAEEREIAEIEREDAA